MAGGSSPRAVMNSRAISAAACSAAFFARATAVKDFCSYPPCGELNAGIVRWQVNLGLAGGGGPSSMTKTGVPPCTCGAALRITSYSWVRNHPESSWAAACGCLMIARIDPGYPAAGRVKARARVDNWGQNLVELMKGRLREARKVFRLAPAAHGCCLRTLPLDGGLARDHQDEACLQMTDIARCQAYGCTCAE